MKAVFQKIALLALSLVALAACNEKNPFDVPDDMVVLNMMDVAKGQGISIDTDALSQKLGIPVVPMSAIRIKDYRGLYESIENALA